MFSVRAPGSVHLTPLDCDLEAAAVAALSCGGELFEDGHLVRLDDVLAAAGLDDPRLFSGSVLWPGVSPAQWRALVRVSGLPGSQVAAVVGVDGRRVREYAGGAKLVPYAVWRLLLVWCHLVEPERRLLAVLREELKNDLTE